MEYLAAHLSDHENTLNKVEKKKGMSQEPMLRHMDLTCLPSDQLVETLPVPDSKISTLGTIR